MITPTKTVCYVRMLSGSLKTWDEAWMYSLWLGWDINDVKRIIVREELL